MDLFKTTLTPYRKRIASLIFAQYSVALLGFSSNKFFEYPVHSLLAQSHEHNKGHGDRTTRSDGHVGLLSRDYSDGLRELNESGGGYNHYVQHAKSRINSNNNLLYMPGMTRTFEGAQLNSLSNLSRPLGHYAHGNKTVTYSPFISRFDDRNIDNNLQGIPTIFLPKLDEGVLYDSNEIVDKIIKIKVDTTNIPDETELDRSISSLSLFRAADSRVIFAFRVSKLNNRGPILSPENDSITRDYTVSPKELCVFNGGVTIRLGSDKITRLPLEPKNLSETLTNRNLDPNSQALKTYLRDQGSSNTFHGVVMHAIDNKLATFFEWQDFILIKLRRGEISTFEFKIKKIQKTLTKDNGTQVTYNLFNWFLQNKE